MVIPSSGPEESLQKSINSILNQTLTPDEIIVIRNSLFGLNPESTMKFHELGITVIDLGKPCGASVARNMGISLAASKYVAFLDDDDEWLPHKLEYQLKTMDAERLNAITTNFWFNREFNRRVFPEQYPHQVKRDIFRRCHCGPGSTLMIERSALLELGKFPEDLIRYEDWYFMIKLRMSGFTYAHSSGVTAVVNRTMHSWDNNSLAIKQFRDKFAEFDPNAFRAIQNGLVFEEAVNARRAKAHLKCIAKLSVWIFSYPPNLFYALNRIIFWRTFRFSHSKTKGK